MEQFEYGTSKIFLSGKRVQSVNPFSFEFIFSLDVRVDKSKCWSGLTYSVMVVPCLLLSTCPLKTFLENASDHF